MLNRAAAETGYETESIEPRPTREELIRIGLPIVRRCAYRMARRLPPNVEVDDLIGAGTEGLLKAAQAYDPTRYPRFEPYAETRIRGAILDELRANDAMTRHGRRRLGEVSRAIRKLQHGLGRDPNEQEVADELGMELEQYQKLSETLARGPALGRLGDKEPDDVAAKGWDPAAALEDKQLRQQLAKAIGSLPERTKMVLALYYQEECTQAEIGQILGVTESRVCQILGEAAARLRAKLDVDTDNTKTRRMKPLQPAASASD